jgi:hypothetical protein
VTAPSSPPPRDRRQGQILYPRRHFFEQICGVLANSPRRHACPIFTDKHLAVTWEDAQFIYGLGQELGLTHMAGSSVPCCFWRDPWLEHPVGTPLAEACVLSYGHLEAYGYHGLEALQAMVERRPGGEAGIAAGCTVIRAQLCRHSLSDAPYKAHRAAQR